MKICYHVSLSKHVEYLSYVVINKKVYNIMKINEMWLNIWIKLMMMLISWWTIIVRVSYTTYILLNGYKLLETSKIQNVVIWYFKWNWCFLSKNMFKLIKKKKQDRKYARQLISGYRWVYEYQLYNNSLIISCLALIQECSL